MAHLTIGYLLAHLTIDYLLALLSTWLYLTSRQLLILGNCQLTCPLDQVQKSAELLIVTGDLRANGNHAFAGGGPPQEAPVNATLL